MNAVIYARYSSQGQNEQSIDGQLRICHDFAERNNLQVVHEYIDKAKTAFKDTNKRTAFNQMLHDSELGKFNVIIVYMLDRFSRNRAESMLTKMKLHEFGVKVISAQENISDTEEGQFFEMFLEYNAEMYSRRLSKRVRDGLTTSVANGTFTGGHLQYGYQVDSNKRVTINELEAENVRFAFEKYAIGWSKKAIAQALNEQGKRYHGQLFMGRHFDNWLNKAKYTGAFSLAGRECNHTYPQIVNQATFDAVQKRLKNNRKNSGSQTAADPYLLNGKAYCGHCGAPMIADGTNKKDGTVYRWYACRNRKKKKAPCNKRNEIKHWLEYYVTERTVAYLSDSDLVQNFAERMVAWYDDKTGQNALKSLATQIAALKKQADNALNLMIANADDKDLVASLKQKNKDLTGQIADLQKEYDDIDYMAGMKLKTEHVVEFINRFINGSVADREFQAKIIKNLVNCVYVYDDKIVIYFNLTNRKETIFVGLDETNETTDNIPTTNSSNVNTLALPSIEKLNMTKYVYYFVDGFVGFYVPFECKRQWANRCLFYVV